MTMTSSNLYGPSEEYEEVVKAIKEAQAHEEEQEVPRKKHAGGRPKGSKNKPKVIETSIEFTPEMLQDVIDEDLEKISLPPVPRIGIYKLSYNVATPSYATDGSACFDLSYNLADHSEIVFYSDANEKRTRTPGGGTIAIAPSETAMIPTGLIFDIPFGYALFVYPRSGTSLKSKLTIINAPGVVDSDYKEEVFLLVHNDSITTQYVFPGDRLAQGEIRAVTKYDFVELTSRPIKTTRDGGFGSTGK